MRKFLETDSSSRQRCYLLACVAVLICSLSAGCAEKIKRFPVRGSVLIDGEPLTYGYVTVAPKGARPALAELDEEGRFELLTYKPGDGTVIGKHKMSVNAGETLDSVSVRWHAPKKYAGLSTSGLLMEVTPDMDEDVVINLTWEGGEPYVESARVSGEE